MLLGEEKVYDCRYLERIIELVGCVRFIFSMQKNIIIVCTLVALSLAGYMFVTRGDRQGSVGMAEEEPAQTKKVQEEFSAIPENKSTTLISNERVTDEESTEEAFQYQPGLVKTVASKGSGQWVISVDLLTHNKDWVPGGRSDFFVNQNPRIRNLEITSETKSFECGEGSDGDATTADVPVTNDVMVKAMEQVGYTAYFDIQRTNITAVYEQCLP